MRKLIATLLGIALLAAGFPPTATATTGTTCDQGIWDPELKICAEVSVPDSIKLSFTKTVTFKVTVRYSGSEDFEPDRDNRISLVDRKSGDWETYDLKPISDTKQQATIKLRPDARPGTYDIELHATGEVGEEFIFLWTDTIATIKVKSHGKKAAKTYMKLAASPKTVGYKGKATLQGSLTAGPNRKVVKKKKVTIFFDPTGERPKRKVATVKTDSKGKFSRSFPQKVPGKWSAVWEGEWTLKKSSASVRTSVKPIRYSYCADLQDDYPGGVARDKSSAWLGGPRYEPVVFRALYTKNRHLDRDKDGVACER